MAAQKHHLISAAVCAVSLSLAGCATPGESALAGAATGAVVGGLVKGGGANVVRGAAIGTVGGLILGQVAESERQKGYAQAMGSYPYPPPPVVYGPPPRVYYGRSYYRRDIPVGRYSETPGFVYSPFAPGILVDVHGIPHGANVVDPANGYIFVNP